MAPLDPRLGAADKSEEEKVAGLITVLTPEEGGNKEEAMSVPALTCDESQ